jgi:phenylacetate-coenzyme A ligase PaaK-like adenylate-forming protein
LSARRLDPLSLRGYLRRMAGFRPAVLYAYSTAAYLLAREAIESGLRCESLQLVILTSETSAPHMVETVERAFGVPAVQEYGSIECGFLAGEYPDRRLRIREDSALLETLPRPDGLYDIVVTVLGNPSFPLFRYLIGDTTDAPLLVPAQGFASLRGIAGRRDDVLVTKAGGLLHAAPFFHVMEDNRAIRRFRARQQADGLVKVLVEAGPDQHRVDVAGLTKRLEALVGFPVLLERVAELPPAAGSKHRTVSSERVGSMANRCERNAT